MFERTWRAGFEVEVILGDLGDPRFAYDEWGPMDMASLRYCRAVAKKLSELTGYKWSAPRESPSRPGFHVVSEYGLDPMQFPSGAVAGVELLTPPLELEQAEAVRRKIIDAIDEMDPDYWNFLDTDISDDQGWHINIDCKPKDMDIDRFILGVDELPILYINGRLLSESAEPQRHAFGIPLLRHLRADPSAALLQSSGFNNFLFSGIGKSKRYAANFAKLFKGYLELRHFSAASFFHGPDLATQIRPVTAAFEMGNESKHQLENRLISRFQILRTWLDDIKPLLETEMGEIGKFVLITPGTIRYKKQDTARLVANEMVEISIMGKKQYSEVVKIRGVFYSDVY